MRKHYIHITSPPDARYSPLGVSAKDKGRPVYNEVRALVVPVIPDRSGNKIVVLPQVVSELAYPRYQHALPSFICPSDCILDNKIRSMAACIEGQAMGASVSVLSLLTGLSSSSLTCPEPQRFSQMRLLVIRSQEEHGCCKLL